MYLQECQNCRFSDAWRRECHSHAGAVRGLCRYNPPGKDSDDWPPIVVDGAWCGKFEPNAAMADACNADFYARYPQPRFAPGLAKGDK